MAAVFFLNLSSVSVDTSKTLMEFYSFLCNDETAEFKLDQWRHSLIE